MKYVTVVLCGVVACGGGDRVGHLPDAAVARPIMSSRRTSRSASSTTSSSPSRTRRTSPTPAARTSTSRRRPCSGCMTPATALRRRDARVSGQGAGPTRVERPRAARPATPALTVYVKPTVVDPPAPPERRAVRRRGRGSRARPGDRRIRSIRILVPPNLGQFDVHWRQHRRTATTCSRSRWRTSTSTFGATRTASIRTATVLDAVRPDAWYPIASSRQQLDARRRRHEHAHAREEGHAARSTVDVTNENAQGGIYYWTTSPTPGIWRYDVAKPTSPPEPYFAERAPGAAAWAATHSRATAPRSR